MHVFLSVEWNWVSGNTQVGVQENVQTLPRKISSTSCTTVLFNHIFLQINLLQLQTISTYFHFEWDVVLKKTELGSVAVGKVGKKTPKESWDSNHKMLLGGNDSFAPQFTKKSRYYLTNSLTNIPHFKFAIKSQWNATKATETCLTAETGSHSQRGWTSCGAMTNLVTSFCSVTMPSCHFTARAGNIHTMTTCTMHSNTKPTVN